MSDVTAMLEAGANGGAISSESLLPLVYGELRRLAAARMMKESPGQTLQPTALVHEAWLRLVGKGDCSWQNRAHFFGAAAQAMRRILVDRSRSRAALKRRTPEHGAMDLLLQPTEDHILMIHESLKRLEAEDPDAARIVLLKFFSGLGSEEIAQMTSCSIRSVERQWTLAKARLYQMIREEGYHRDLKAS